MRHIALALSLTGCSTIFMEQLPDRHVMGQPAHCTGTKGFVAWDGVLVAANAISAGALLVADQKVWAGANVAFALGHLLSAASGSGSADACREARAAERPAPVAMVQPRPTATTAPERKTVYGATPLWCASVAVDVGQCFTTQTACETDIATSGAPGCEQRHAGSCFNATKTLDATKSTVCAVSIKDCEDRRATFSSNPDYTLTRCGIYRAK